MRKKILTTLMAIILLSGLYFSSIPFTSSLKPSAKAKSDRVHIDISKIECGAYAFEKFYRDNAWNFKVLILKEENCSLHVYLIPTKENKVIMPERFWGHGSGFCSDFSPTVDANNKLLAQGEIICKDKILEQLYISDLKWSYSGKSLSKWVVEDLYSPKYEMQNNVLILSM